MQYPDYLSQMAALVRENPSITVREIAAKLQFADSKSVYYWLGKGNVSGINEFKRLVLAGEDPRPPALGVGTGTHYALTLPLFAWNPQQKNPVGEWYHFDTDPDPQGLFALRVGSNDFSPWFAEQDVLIVCAGGNIAENAWIVLRTEQEFFLARVVNEKFIHPATLQNYPDFLTPVGTVISQTRYFSS